MKRADSNRKPAPNNTHAYSTSKRGRRAIASLWAASRAVNGALLTADDLALIHEVLNEIWGALS